MSCGIAPTTEPRIQLFRRPLSEDRHVHHNRGSSSLMSVRPTPGSYRAAPGCLRPLLPHSMRARRREHHPPPPTQRGSPWLRQATSGSGRPTSPSPFLCLAPDVATGHRRRSTRDASQVASSWLSLVLAPPIQVAESAPPERGHHRPDPGHGQAESALECGAHPRREWVRSSFGAARRARASAP